MFGTDLQSAYAPFASNDGGNTYADVFQMSAPQETIQHDVAHKSTPLSQITHNNNQMMQPIQQPTALTPASKQQLPSTAPIQMGYGNEQQDPRIAVLLNELKKQQKIVANIENQNGYFDRLGAKRKDVMRILQLSLVIVLALSLHFVVDHYLKNYLKNHDLSFERELIMRLLYPIAVIFIIWNMKAFIK
jgi:hypothetical protein